MRADISRETHRVERHYSRVLWQQGRVQLDADLNEQQALHQERAETAGRDVIGATGAPKAAPGFSVRVQDGTLVLGRGHYYVDGTLCRNDGDVALTDQPHLPGSTLPATDGLYLAYLRAWERHISPLQDGALRETALGGPDTTHRTQTTWQVRLLPVADPGAAAGCGTPLPEWDALRAQVETLDAGGGTMQARLEAQAPTPDPLCILPPAPGYRGLENQLYRVEVHRGGGRGQARFKWSRENGSVVTAVVEQSGGELVVADVGKDDVLGFAGGHWAELSDDRADLAEQHGELRRIATVTPGTRTVVLEPPAPAAVDPAGHPTLRRWDQDGDTATADGVALTGDWQPLEGGLQVRFQPGAYKPGDYWLVPARTAVGGEAGTIEWPTDAGGGPLALPPGGTRHRLARLALVRRAAGAFQVVDDCRALFPPLTGITATDVSFDDTTSQLGAGTVQEAIDALHASVRGGCTLHLHPGDDLAAAVAAFQGDGSICLREGTYELPATLVVQGKGHLRIHGAGTGTRLVAPAGSEAALVVQDCPSVSVSDCAFSGGTPGTARLMGALTVLDCADVDVSGVVASCPHGPRRAATCITIRNSAAFAQQHPFSSARVRGCRLDAGHQQTGLLIVNAARVHVEDNTIAATGSIQTAGLLQDAVYRAKLRSTLFSHAALMDQNPPPSLVAATNAEVIHQGFRIRFRTNDTLVRGATEGIVNEWQKAVDALQPGGVTSSVRLKEVVEGFAGSFLTGGGRIGGFTTSFLSQAFTRMVAQDTVVAAQGVVVAGSAATDVRVVANDIRAVLQGVHVALSHRGAGGPDQVRTLLVDGNTVEVDLPSSATGERHGIFVGSCGSAVIEANYIRLRRGATGLRRRIEAVRMYGRLGRRIVVRHNHFEAGTAADAFDVGVRFNPTNPTGSHLWLVTENLMDHVVQMVERPAGVEVIGIAGNRA